MKVGKEVHHSLLSWSFSLGKVPRQEHVALAKAVEWHGAQGLSSPMVP